MSEFGIIKYLLFFLVFVAIPFIFKVSSKIYKQLKERQYLKKLSQSDIKDIDKMDGLQFEIYLKVLLKELGYRVKETKSTQDFGADLIALKGNEKISIQAKRYGYKNKVGVDAIQQVYSSIPYYKTNKAWVITNNYLTKNAHKLADVCNVIVHDRIKLVNWIEKINPTVTARNIRNTVPPKERKCLSCGEVMIIRTNQNSQQFFGCSRFPKCKHTESINS